jgi:hypothetical protein
MTRLPMALLWTALILVACAWPSNRLPIEETGKALGQIKHLDKVVHAALFAGFGFFWVRVGGIRLRLFLLIVVGIMFAAVTELLQLIPAVGRDADWDDLGADAIGLLLGIAVGLRFSDPGLRRVGATDRGSRTSAEDRSVIAHENFEVKQTSRPNL